MTCTGRANREGPARRPHSGASPSCSWYAPAMASPRLPDDSRSAPVRLPLDAPTPLELSRTTTETASVIRWLLQGPWLQLALLCAVFLVVGPWVDIPLNDDWQYARAAKLLAETGTLTIDTPIAPSIVVQSYLGALVIKLFGFSHIALRLLTVMMAGIGLVCVERALRHVRVPRSWALAACALVVINPIALHSTIAFMSEWYGVAFALLSVALWFRVRARTHDEDPLPIWLYLLAAALAVTAFWSRQTVVVVYPALVASRWRPLLRDIARRRPRELLGALLGTAVVAAGVLGYFAWLHATDNYKPAFDKPMSALSSFSPKLWLIQFSSALAYMSASFAPLLLLVRVRRGSTLHFRVGAACAAFMLAGLLALQVTGGHGFVANRWLNARFPYVSNLIYPTGVGPVTTTEIGFHADDSRPNWKNENIWLYIEYAVLLSTVLWGALAGPTRAARDVTDPRGARNELAWFAAAWLLGTLALTVQAHQDEVFDRYYFEVIAALALLVPVLLTNVDDPIRPRSWLRWSLAAGTFGAIAWFSVAGTHDYLRWQQVRAKLYAMALASGISPSSIDAGYELNGWNNLNQQHPSTCIGRCSCKLYTWYCHDNSYRIVMGGVPGGYHELAARQPQYWLADGPPLRLVERNH